VQWTTDLREALVGAQYVVNVLRAGGAEAESHDRRLLAASGVVGHAAGYLEALRNLPPTIEVARAAEEIAPNAVLINFTNPVSILCEALAQMSSVVSFGVCHHAFNMRCDFARLLNVSPDLVRVEYQGINHLGWVTDVQVSGESQFSLIVQRLRDRHVKAYNYDRVAAINAIPIKHAYSLYRGGEVLYVREKGLRASAVDIAIRALPWMRRLLLAQKRDPAEHMLDALAAGRLECLEAFGSRAPWYASCIVPFVDTLETRASREHIVTWNHRGQVADLPSATAEFTTAFTQGDARPTTFAARLPDKAGAWLRQIRESESLLVRASAEHSRTLLVEALRIHPNVASAKHAERFVHSYMAGAAFSNA
jgi:6-phospho-beta-glucosidase